MIGKWHFWIDRGGTFTDVVAFSPAGEMRTLKLLSDNPEQYDDAALEAVKRISGSAEGLLPTADIRIGTTIATNALLERKGEPVLLAITSGFGDALRIGTQERGDIFALNIHKPDPLPAETLEIEERIGADGKVYRALNIEAARKGLAAARRRGITAVAICLMHGYRYHAHEQALGKIARELGFEEVALSHEVSPLARLISRADCTSLDAYLSPVLQNYTRRLAQGFGPQNDPLFMQSNGGLAQRSSFRGKDAVLSGPAGGIVGMAETSRAAGYERVIGFDMGGTSTDVSLYAGEYLRDNDNRIEGVRIRVPMMRIHTIAAGGGSVCGFDGARMTVGPESAGAQPGPASYGAGGPLTVTDCNLLLRKLLPEHFPSVFGAKADKSLSLSAAEQQMDSLLARMREAGLDGQSREEVAEGFITIACAAMANAVRAVSVAKGHDVENFALNCFGGAGGQHACLVAERLGIKTVLVHPLSGVLSAYGMGLAVLRELREVTVNLPIDGEGTEDKLKTAVELLKRDARATLIAQGAAAEEIGYRVEVHIRAASSDSTIAVTLSPLDVMRSDYACQFRAQFGYVSNEALVIDSIQVEAGVQNKNSEPVTNSASPTAPSTGAAPTSDSARCYMGGAWHEIRVYRRAELPAGFTLAGPALIADPVATIVIEPGWCGAVTETGMIVLTHCPEVFSKPKGVAASDDKHLSLETPDPVRLEIFGSLFMAIAEEMGAALQHSAASVNIRERLDFSCALFDQHGALVANAPHMPVHLGSMGDSVRAVIDAHGADMHPGDGYALNAPWRGGTHLPDITVVAPVFLPGASEPSWYVAARGHHADIGGIAPGSMPADSTSLDEEGIVLDAVPVRRDGKLREEELRSALGSGPHPARNIDQNIADIAAQLAACNRGQERLIELAQAYGVSTVSAYMEHLQRYSADAVSRLIAQRGGDKFRVETDDGAKICVEVRTDQEQARAVIDFTGTSGQLANNFNAPEPVVRAACLYVIRTLIDTDIPMNDGFLRPIEIVIPKGSMLSPSPDAAVVAGNVETSQLVTDCLLGAFGALAASQGTMNNFTFGDDTHQYYETIAGGAGAGDGFAGADAVQTHMTNSRLTDPEILEARFPVMVEEYKVRRGSGGAGKWRGGDGTSRRLRFLAPMRAQILSGRRVYAPFGLADGNDGACGANAIIRGDGTIEPVAPCAAADMEPGDSFVIETPGGGGYGLREGHGDEE